MTSIASGSIAAGDSDAHHDSLNFVSPDIADTGYFLYSVAATCAPIMRGMSTLISPRSLFLASAAVCIGPAVWLLISPATLFAVYGLTLDSAGIFVGRVLCTAMVALALLFWEARDAAGTPLDALAGR